MIYQFGIVAVVAICATVCVIFGQPQAAAWIMGGCIATFLFSVFVP